MRWWFMVVLAKALYSRWRATLIWSRLDDTLPSLSPSSGARRRILQQRVSLHGLLTKRLVVCSVDLASRPPRYRSDVADGCLEVLHQRGHSASALNRLAAGHAPPGIMRQRSGVPRFCGICWFFGFARVPFKCTVWTACFSSLQAMCLRKLSLIPCNPFLVCSFDCYPLLFKRTVCLLLSFALKSFFLGALIPKSNHLQFQKYPIFTSGQFWWVSFPHSISWGNPTR